MGGHGDDWGPHGGPDGDWGPNMGGDPDSWGPGPHDQWGPEPMMEMENNCAMNQKMRLDGSCKKCKKPYVQSEDGMSCEFVGYRTYGGGADGQSKYMGRLKDYRQYGKGFYKWSSNNSYFGMWLQGMKHGQGIKKFADGSEYQGEWRNDEMEGWGRYTYKSGKVYEGELRRGKYDG